MSAERTGRTRSNRLPITRLGPEIVADKESALEREWLVTNGIGGFASASLSGANTRRYHGLLIAALQPPLGRTLLLGKLDEEISLNKLTYRLDVNEWRGGTASLSGLNYLESFEQLGNLPTFTYRLGEARFTKTIWMEYGLNTTYVRYEYLAPPEARSLELRVRPLANCRDYHEATRGSLNLSFEVVSEAQNCWRVTAWPEAPQWRLLVFDRPAQWRPEAESGWFWGFHYRQEQARELAGADEDMYSLGTFVTSLEPGQSVTFVATTAEVQTVRALYLGAYERELTRLEGLLKLAGTSAEAKDKAEQSITTLVERLTLAADQFVVGRPDAAHPGQLQSEYRTVLAGYPWFSDWGRDTMISLPGLTLVTGRYNEAATILRSFARFVDRGMLPNRFLDGGEALDEGEYNTVDATVWYFDAIDKYIKSSGDLSLGRELYPVLSEIIRWHVQGTRFNIKVDQEDGLLSSGAPGVQLTWMDAKVGEWVITPRRGKPIEISALWYRACRMMQELADKFGETEQANYAKALADRVAANFERVYWYEQGGYFYDVIDEEGRPDPALRPNQAIALAVAPELASLEKRQSALAQVREHLLTPYGLRTLSPQDPNYRPTYDGDALSRDSAYHQGTVWPWPLGPYARALLQAGADQTEVRALLVPFVDQLDEGCVGQVNEIFGAEAPFPAVGCIAQAWSISELLEIWLMLKAAS